MPEPTLIMGIVDWMFYWYVITVILLIIAVFGGREAFVNIKCLLGKRKGIGKIAFIRNNNQLEIVAGNIAKEEIDIPLDKSMKYYARPKMLILFGRTAGYIYREGEAEPINPVKEAYKFDAKRIQQIIKMARFAGKLQQLEDIVKRLKLLTIISLATGGGSIVLLILLAQRMGLFGS